MGGAELVQRRRLDVTRTGSDIRLARIIPFDPENLSDERKGDIEVIEELLRTEKKAVAIGEIGLDYHYNDGASKEAQIDLFKRQLALSKDLDIPVCIHDRDAHSDTLEILKEFKPKGVVHCFSGSVEMMNEVTKLGMYIGLGGVVTFKNAKKAVKVATEVPVDKLLLETDCPYMAPTPFRGERNDSSLISYVAEVISGLKNISYSEILKITYENGIRLFNI